MISKIQALKDNQGLMKYFKNTNWLLLDRFYSMGLSFVVSIYVIRYLGPEQFGLLSYSLTFVQLFMPVVGMGLSGILVRDIVKKPREEKLLMSSAFLLRLLLGVAAYMVILLYLMFSNGALLEKYSIAIMGLMLLLNAFLVLEDYLMAKVKAKLKSLSKITAVSIISIAKLIMVYYEMPLIYFVTALVVENGIYFIFLTLVYFRNHALELTPKLNQMKVFVVTGWPFVLAAFSLFLFKKIDILIVKYFLGLSVVGYYSVASRITELLIVIPMVVLGSIFPLLVKKDTEERLNDSLIKLYRIMTISVIPIVLFISLFADEIIVLLFGESYVQSGSLLAIYAWAAVLMTIHMISNKWFLIKNLQKEFFYRAISAGVLNVALSIMLTKAYGAKGAAVGTLFSMFFLTYISLFFSKNGRILKKLIEQSIYLRRVQE